MRILVFGAGGRLGSRVALEAAARGHEVVGIVRARRPSVVADGVAIVKGDVRSPGPILADHPADLIVSAVGAAPHAETPDYEIYRDAATALLAAAEAVPGLRIIAVGGAGSLVTPEGGLLVDSDTFPRELRPEAQAQAAALATYRTSTNHAWTYISPAAQLEPGERLRDYRVAGEDLVVDEQGRSRISMEDYAVAVVDEAESARHLGERFSVGY